MIVVSIPTLICAISMMMIIPESPKFTFTQGREHETLEILEKIYRKNTKNFDFRIKSLMKDEEFSEGQKNWNNIFSYMWIQTKPLFQQPHLYNTLRACFIQFSIFAQSNGFWVFFPEISNGVTIWKRDHNDESATLCEIFESTRSHKIFGGNSTANIDENICLTKLELSSFYNFFLLNFAYTFGWLISSLIINRVGKLIIITSILFTSSSCAFLLMFVTNSTISSVLYILVLAVGLALTVLNASTAELFPTQYRAMALCLSLMSGRIGAVVGSNLIGAMMDNYCTFTFLMPVILLTSSGFLAYTIPNISRRI